MCGRFMLKALLFDVDGTLADTERLGHRVAFNLAFDDAGLDWNWSEALYGELLAVTGGKERMRFFCDNHLPDFVPEQGWESFLKELHLAKNAHYAKLLEEGKIGLRPGVKRLIEEARAEGLRLAVATTTSPENVDALLSNALAPDAMSWFECIAAGDIVPAKKPAPDIYLWAMEQMNLTPADCLAFEDSSNGIQSSSGADLTTIITVNDYTRDDDFSAAALVVDQLGEPGEPMQVLAGDANGAAMIDVATARYVHGKVHG